MRLKYEPASEPLLTVIRLRTYWTPLPNEKGTTEKGLKTFAPKMTQVKARIWP